MKRAWTFLIFFCSCSLLFANPATDSLENLLLQQPNDSLQLAILNELAYQTSKTDLSLSLSYADQGLALANTLQDKVQKRQLLHLKALVHYELGNYDQCMRFFRQVQQMFEEEQDKWGVSRMLNNLGILYSDLEQYPQALEHYQKALSLKKELGDSSSISSTLSNIGIVYLELDQLEKAHAHFMEALQLDLTQNNKEGLVYSYENMGQLFARQKAYDSALYYYSKSISLLPEGQGEQEKTSILSSIGDIYLQKGLPLEAIRQLEKAIAHGRKINARNRLKDSYQKIAQAYSLLQDYKSAYHYHQQYNALKDSIFKEEKLEKIKDIESNYQIQQREKEIELLRKDAQISSLHLSQNRLISYFLYAGLFFFFSGMVFLYRQYKSKHHSNHLLQQHNQEILNRNDHITSSIKYARTIQEAILPQENHLLLHFPDAFVLSQARDIVNGDFYWFFPKKDFILLAVVDCTGHGVPGAFMTIMANSLLNQIIIDQQNFAPSRILEELQDHLRKNLHQEKDFQASKDGLDLIICKIEPSRKRLTYASAKRPLYLMQEGDLKVYKNNKSSLVGPLSQPSGTFQEEELPYEKGNCLYLFTDGLTDQFGESADKKFMPYRLKRLLKDIHSLPLQQQKRRLQESLRQWQGQLEQTDDILILGLRL